MLIKYLLSFFIINFILLTNNYIVKAAEAPHSVSETPQPTKETSSSSTNTTTGCVVDDDSPCVQVNNTLIRCNGILTTPDQYIDKKILNGTYVPEHKSLAKCMCNQEFHDLLTSCIGCFKKSINAEFEVASVDEFKSSCKKFGVEYTQETPDEIKTGLSPRVKYAIVVVAITFLLIIMGLIGYKCCVRRREKNRKKENRDSIKPLTLSSKNLHDEPLMWNNDKTKSTSSSINVSESNIGVDNSQQPQPIITDYQQQHQQQNYYPTSSTRPINNIQIPIQSGEISYYPPSENPTNLKSYYDLQNNNTSDGYYAGHNVQYKS